MELALTATQLWDAFILAMVVSTAGAVVAGFIALIRWKGKVDSRLDRLDTRVHRLFRKVRTGNWDDGEEE